MSDFTTGIGELGQGALIARAAEPTGGTRESGDADTGHTHERACLNCGTQLVGSHCHACGQAAHVHRTLGAFFHDLAHGVFHVEGKIWRTLPMLAWRPGKLTREYIEGKRASYVSPMALFLFSVFLFFAAIHMLEGGENGSTLNVDSPADIAAQKREVERVRAELAKATESGERKDLSAELAAESAELALDLADKSPKAGQAEKPRRWNSSIPWIERALNKAQENPELAIYKLQMSAYKYSWLLIPISVPMLWLLFPFSRRFRLYDHTVFVTYSLAFMTLFIVVLSIAGALGLPQLGLLAMIVVPLHMYRQLRGSYGLRRRSAIWRTVALLVFSGTALALFAAALLSMEYAA